MKKLISVCLTLFLSLGLFVSVSAEEGEEITFTEFIETIVTNGEFDGQDATVKWEPDETVQVIQRVQNNNAQYQIAEGKDFDIVIKNTHFEYVSADIPNHSVAWNTGENSYTADQIRNAEFQLLNTGDVTVENCTFEKIIVSPYGNNAHREDDSDRNFTVKNSTFSNVYNAYALKDIYTANALIEGNTFTNCAGAIYFEGGTYPSVERGTIEIKNNVFDNIDKNCQADKENTRGIIQLSDDFNAVESTKFIFEGNTILTNEVKKSADDVNNLAVIRYISTHGSLSIEGWKAGEAFSVLANTSGIILPDLGNEPQILSDGTYIFLGWVEEEKYQGPVADVADEAILKAGYSNTTEGIRYYAVWEFVPNEEETVPSISCAGEKDKNCDGVVTCDEEMGEGWIWNNDKGVCEYNGASSYVVVNTAVK